MVYFNDMMFQNYGSCISCGVIRDIMIFKFYNSLIITENTAKEKEESMVFYSEYRIKISCNFFCRMGKIKKRCYNRLHNNGKIQNRGGDYE